MSNPDALTVEEVNLILGFCRRGLAEFAREASFEVLDKGTAAVRKFAEIADAQFKPAKEVEKVVP